MPRLLPVFVVLLCGCSGSHQLTVDLVTPREGGVAFDRVRVTLDPGAEAAEHEARLMSYASPVRVAEFAGVPEEVYAVTVSLLLGDAVVAEQQVMVWVRNDTSVVVRVGAEVCVAASEICNGVDDDCDQAIDEEASEEVCNGRDDDCDGEVDEGSGASLCPSADGAEELACAEGGCVVGACIDARADCDGDYDNGCEVDPTSDPAHCGGCGAACEAEASCDASACRLRGRPEAFARFGGTVTDRVLGVAPAGTGVHAGGVETRVLNDGGASGGEAFGGSLQRGWVERRTEDGALSWRTQRLGPVMAVAAGPDMSVVGVSRASQDGAFTEVDCGDGLDDDCDRLVDCLDPDCRGTASGCDCAGPERCGNGEDDDCDGQVDCQDPDCAGRSACDCTGTAETCGDGIDNDCDGDVDCDDDDCGGVFVCNCFSGERERFCDDGIDNDCDGRTDRNDPDCAAADCTEVTDPVAFALDDEGAQLWQTPLEGSPADVGVADEALHVIADGRWFVGEPSTGTLGPGLNDPEDALTFLAVDAHDGRVGLVFRSGSRVTVEIGGELRGYPSDAYAAAMLDSEGQFLWDRVFTQPIRLSNVAVSRAGLAVRGVIPTFREEPVDLGAGPVEFDPRRPEFIVALSELGAFLFERRIPNVSGSSIVSPSRRRPIAMSPSGDVWVGGTVDEEIDFGGGRRPTYLPAGWVAVYDAAGVHRWDQVYVNPGAAFVEALATTAEGGWVGGAFDSRVDFGLGPAVSAGTEDGFLLRVSD